MSRRHCWRFEETDLARGSAWIRGKGKREKELIPLPLPVIEAIRRYLRHRGGTAKGPLFLTRSGRISRVRRSPAADAQRSTRRAGARAEGRPARLVSQLAPHEHHAGRRSRAESWPRAGQDPRAQPAPLYRDIDAVRRRTRPAENTDDIGRPRREYRCVTALVQPT
jgi:hypothetical protein